MPCEYSRLYREYSQWPATLGCRFFAYLTVNSARKVILHSSKYEKMVAA